VLGGGLTAHSEQSCSIRQGKSSASNQLASPLPGLEVPDEPCLVFGVVVDSQIPAVRNAVHAHAVNRLNCSSFGGVRHLVTVVIAPTFD